jgi:hypothetical protein
MGTTVRTAIAATLIASSADAQKLLLELRPHAGDTLRMQMEQVTELSSGRAGSPLTTMTTTMRMFSRAIVESTAPIAALILAVTDSVDVSGSDVSARSLAEQARREIQGRQMRLRLWPDGTVTLNDGAKSVPREVSDLVSVMPASFPSRPVAVGETWTREMPIPAGEQLGIPVGSSVRARFRLDSVSASSDEAWVSISGVLQPSAATAGTNASCGPAWRKSRPPPGTKRPASSSASRRRCGSCGPRWPRASAETRSVDWRRAACVSSTSPTSTSGFGSTSA